MKTVLPPPGLIKLSPAQHVVFHCPARFRVLVAGRRFGKTYLALAEILRTAHQGRDRLIWYVGPNDRQSKRIVWSRLKAVMRPYCAQRPNESEMRMHLHNGTTIVVNGAFHPDSLRGVGLDLLILDEFASIKPEAWREVFRPALADRQGRALFIGTPKGRNHFYEHFEYAQNDPAWQAFQFTTADGRLVAHTELTSAARELDPESYRQEFGAEFIGTGRNRAYYTFDPATHVCPVTFDPHFPLIWSLDFNVNPMCMLLLQRTDDSVQVIDEIILREGHTEAACQAVLERIRPLADRVPHPHRPMQIDIYGDASGHQKRTSAVATDWSIVRHFFSHWKGVFRPYIHVKSSNPPVRDRINCVNSRLKSHSDAASLFIDPRCRELIKDLSDVAWQTDATGAATSELDKSDRRRTHTSDALGYYIAQAFPLKPLIGPRQERLI